MKKTKEQISYNMQRIKNKDSDIEILLRKELWKNGLRYRKNAKDIFGKPDLVFKSKKIAIFCDSEFWHGYDWKNQKKDFKSNQTYWFPKIEQNIKRDIQVNEELTKQGWTVLRFWGNDIKKHLPECVEKIIKIYREKTNDL